MSDQEETSNGDELSEETEQKVTDAVAELFDMICKELTTDEGINIETAIAAAGWLTGAALLAATNIDLSELEPGTAVLVDAVDDEGPTLIGYIGSMLTESGVDVSDIAEEVPPQHQPLRNFLEISIALGQQFRDLLAHHELPSEAGILVGAQTTAQFVYAGQELVDPSIGMALAVSCVVSGAKTVPGRA